MDHIRNEKGLAMPVALLVMLVVSLLGAALWQYGMAGLRQVESMREGTNAHYLARSGAEATLAYIMQDQISANIQARINELVGEHTIANGVTMDGVVVPVAVSVSANGNNSDITITATATDNGMQSVVRRRIYRTPHLVAVGNSGEILTYAGGNNWAQRIDSSTNSNWTTEDLNGIVWGGPPDNAMLVAVGSSGTILTSRDAVTWMTRVSKSSSRLNDVAWGTVTVDGNPTSMFVAVGDGGTILTSPDGITWTPQTSGTGEQLDSVAWGNNTFVAVGGNGTTLRSTNGTLWLQNDLGDNYDFNDVTWGSNMFLAVSDRYVDEGWLWDERYYLWATSTNNGVSWTKRDEYDSDARNLMAVGWGSNSFAAAGEGGMLVQFQSDGDYEGDERDDDFEDTILGFSRDGDFGWAVGHSRKIACYDFDDEDIIIYDLGTVHHLNDITSINAASGGGTWVIDTMW